MLAAAPTPTVTEIHGMGVDRSPFRGGTRPPAHAAQRPRASCPLAKNLMHGADTGGWIWWTGAPFWGDDGPREGTG